MYEDMEVLRSTRMRVSTMWQARTTRARRRSSARTSVRRRSAAEHEAVPLRAQLRRARARRPRPAPAPAPAPVSAKKSRMSRTAFLKSWPNVPAWRSAWRSA
ncbi:MAG: hypothetical protein ACLT4C_09505 [Butyricicoccus sp.]